MKRLLVALLAAAFASPFVATPDVARVASQAPAVRAIPDAPDTPASAHRADAGRSVLAVRDTRAPHHGTRPGDQQACPEFSGAAARFAEAHARSTGLRTAPISARALTFTFDATAPPATRVSA